MKNSNTMKYKKLIILVIASFITGVITAQNDSEARSFIKTIRVNKESSLEVINKYGKIHISPWNKDSVSIRAEVKATGSNKSRFDKIFDGIEINISDAGPVVRAETEFKQNINMLLESFKGMTGKFITYDSRIEINYFISMPAYLGLRIDNKYGDIYMEDCSGTSSISLSNGSFRANSIQNSSSLNFTFCDVTINSISTAKIDASFSDFTIGEAEDLNISSLSSKFDIKKVSALSTESRRDKFFITRAGSLKGNSYFTDFNINTLKKEIDLTTRYGKLDAGTVETGFEKIDLNSGYCDISLGFEPSCSFSFDIRHLNSFLVLPEKNIKSEKKVINEDKKEYITFGTAGKYPGMSKVKINATHGNIYIK